MKSAPVVFPLGRQALDWLWKGGKPDRGGLMYRVLYNWQSWWFERNISLQARLFSSKMPQDNLIFILGLWRSGTTFLHDLLSACPGVIYPTTAQCMNPSTFLLRHPAARGKTSVRPMDEFIVDAFSPQEDEFALLALGVPSVYRAFLDPRRLSELAILLKPETWKRESPGNWMETWQMFLSAIAEGRSERFLLKSPTHTFRIQPLAVAFPSAIFLWVVRDPVEVLLSNRKMWVSMWKRYALWNWEHTLLDDFLQHALESAAQCLTYAVRTLPSERFAVIDFSHLTTLPVDTIAAINARFRLADWNQLSPKVQSISQEKAAYRKDTYSNDVLPSTLRAAVDALQTAQAEALNRFGL